MILADEGNVRTVKMSALTVGDALERLGVEVGESDRVTPSLDSPLSERVEIHRAKQVTVVFNGHKRVERVTGITVAQILRELRVSPEGAAVYPPLQTRIRIGQEIVVAKKAIIQVIHDGKTETVSSGAPTAESLLGELGITLGPLDRVEPDLAARPDQATPIRVIRVTEVIERTIERVPFRRIIRETEELESGERKILASGVEGEQVRVTRRIYEDGKFKRTLTGTEVIRPAQDEVTLVGRRNPQYRPGGNSERGKASWYNTPGNGLTAAHKTLPKGTVVRVTNLAADGRFVDVVIADRGPFVTGRIIDLSEEAFQRLAPLGSGVLDVKIEW
ncbi:MAG: ubiquitin-like domain-containing protein [Actinomycetota bacterium]